jgi:hypothetical protein
VSARRPTQWRRFGVYPSFAQPQSALRLGRRRRLRTRILAKVGQSPRRTLPARQSVGAEAEHGVISQPTEGILTIDTSQAITISGPSLNPAFYGLDQLGIGRSRFCLTDDCTHIDIALFAVSTIKIRGGRRAIERCPSEARDGAHGRIVEVDA